MRLTSTNVLLPGPTGIGCVFHHWSLRTHLLAIAAVSHGRPCPSSLNKVIMNTSSDFLRCVVFAGARRRDAAPPPRGRLRDHQQASNATIVLISRYGATRIVSHRKVWARGWVGVCEGGGMQKRAACAVAALRCGVALRRASPAYACEYCGVLRRCVRACAPVCAACVRLHGCAACVRCPDAAATQRSHRQQRAARKPQLADRTRGGVVCASIRDRLQPAARHRPKRTGAG